LTVAESHAKAILMLTSGWHQDILLISFQEDIMPTRSPATAAAQIAFRYRAVDSATGVTRETAKRLAEQLGVDETQAIHRALHDLAVKLLPQYEADDGPLSAAQVRQIKKATAKNPKRSVRSSLLTTASA
jgi:citrate lyase synthetase